MLCLDLHVVYERLWTTIGSTVVVQWLRVGFASRLVIGPSIEVVVWLALEAPIEGLEPEVTTALTLPKRGLAAKLMCGSVVLMLQWVVDVTGVVAVLGHAR